MQVRSLGGEDPLEEEMATHSSILAWRIPRTEEPGRLQFIGLQRVGHDWSDLAHMHKLTWNLKDEANMIKTMMWNKQNSCLVLALSAK